MRLFSPYLKARDGGPDSIIQDYIDPFHSWYHCTIILTSICIENPKKIRIVDTLKL